MSNKHSESNGDYKSSQGQQNGVLVSMNDKSIFFPISLVQVFKKVSRFAMVILWGEAKKSDFRRPKISNNYLSKSLKLKGPRSFFYCTSFNRNLIESVKAPCWKVCLI